MHFGFNTAVRSLLANTLNVVSALFVDPPANAIPILFDSINGAVLSTIITKLFVVE